MPKVMKLTSIISIVLTLLFVALFGATSYEFFSVLAITAGTIAYHFSMRLVVGGVYDALLNNKVDYRKKWFRISKFEQKLYNLLKVKEWKGYFPTYDPDAFDKQKHSWEEIASAMCQSELVHETIIVLSFLPIFASLWFGEALVFVLTSLFSALFDSIFVVIQRYNRPRVLRILNKNSGD